MVERVTFSRYERAIRRNASRAGKDPDRALAATKAAVTRSARARGVDPRRAWSAAKGAFTRASNRDTAARVHGQKARETSERKLTGAQKGARTRDAGRIERGGEPSAPVRDRWPASSLDFDAYDGEWEFYDVETSPDYGD